METEAFGYGLVVAFALVGAIVCTAGIAQYRQAADLRQQCEQQGSLRLKTYMDGDVIFYCNREPKK